MKVIILVLLISIVGFDCTERSSNKNPKLNVLASEVPVTDEYLKLLWGSSENVDSSNDLELAIHYLNSSKYKRALRTLKGKYTLDTVNVGGFYGFTIGSKEVSNYERYIAFRLNEYIGNLRENELEVHLIKSVVDSTNDLYALQSIEYEYLQNRRQRNNDVAKKMVDELKRVLQKYPKSKRLQFLLANEYLAINNTKAALKIFDVLIADNYYALISLRTITQYLSFNKSSILKKYLLLFEDKFPDECKLQSIKLLFATMSEDSLVKLCARCIKSDFQKDSIFSKLYLAKFYLNKKQFDKVDALTTDFNNNYDVFVFDSTLLFERGLYSDIKMRSLFLQRRYNEICKFIETDLGYNLVIKIDNKEELKTYIQHLYGEYISYSMDNFDTFFRKNFICYKE